jgi:aspartyl-tRNA(Asn)/glutamyl-tRNA(Gln) amidotransferase subunit B
MATPYGDYEPVIGLEVHAQLLTRTKAFCGCMTSFGDPPNTHTCPVCLGLPGALPVLNAEAVRMATLAALALGCTIQETSIFARKNYFYPDLPKGYQISQYDRPLALHGFLDIELDGQSKKRIGILRVHMEEDAGKNLHGVGSRSIVDLNRAGTALIEIVGDPDLRSAGEAAEYLKRLREVLMALGVNDGNLEQGSFRCDANVSVRKRGATALGTRTELKNINSFRFVAEAIDIEIRRQIEVVERGERVRMQTRGFNADKHETFAMRDKEGEAGYRYFPEPDLPPLKLEAAYIAAVQRAMPELPAQRRARYESGLGLTPYAAGVMASHPMLSTFFEQAQRLFSDAVKVANLVQSEVLRDVKTTGLTASFPVSPAQVAELLALIEAKTISGKQAKEVYAQMVNTERMPRAIVDELGLSVLSDEGAIERLASVAIEQNPKQAAAYRSGKATMLGFFVGHIMKQTGGSASPAVVNDVLKRLLGDAAAPSQPTAPPAEAAPKAPAAPLRAPSAAPTTTASAPAAEPVAPAAALEAIAFDAFARIELRVGLITSAARIAKKDKLLDLRVDVGEADGPRRIVAGLALSFAPEALVGQRVIVVCNLEPRAFTKELVSHGMLLASGPSDALALATVTGEVPPGTRVK